MEENVKGLPLCQLINNGFDADEALRDLEYVTSIQYVALFPRVGSTWYFLQSI